jgi:AAA family ATP:ADP antiporter
MIQYWSFTLFYVMSELWGNIILMMIFWGFANQITSFGEAKRFYGIFGIGINLSGIFSGEISIMISKYGASWDTSLTYLLALVTGAGLACIGTFFFLNRYLKKHPNMVSTKEEPIAKNKPKMSFRKSLSVVFSSKYMLCLMTLVLSYNVIINLVEVLWKHEAQQLYPDTQSYSIFMNEVTVYTGVLATTVSLFISGNCLRYCGWTKTAMITPLILLITSVGFFSCFFLKSTSFATAFFLGLSPLNFIVFFGTMQNCLSRAAKYTVFDATKEMAYIPLSQEDKISAKAAIDGVFNRMGKSTGSFLYQGLLLIFSTISASAPYVAIILALFLIIWMIAIRSLGGQISQIDSTKQEPVPILIKE